MNFQIIINKLNNVLSTTLTSLWRQQRSASSQLFFLSNGILLRYVMQNVFK